MSQIGALIQEFRDGERGVISDAEIARQCGVTRGAVGGWIRGLSSMPKPEHLRKLALYIGVPYDRVLQAALADAGYYGSRSVTVNAQHTAPMTTDGPGDDGTGAGVPVPDGTPPPAGSGTGSAGARVPRQSAPSRSHAAGVPRTSPRRKPGRTRGD